MTKQTKSGGAFLFEHSEPEKVFTWEDFDEESLAFARTASDFATKEVLSRRAALEADDTKLATHRELLRQAGELGLLMVEIPEEHSGLGRSFTTSMLVSEHLAKQGSFTTSIMCHTGIGTAPILLFGNDAQRQRYLPGLATGEIIGAYALTEEGYGSDALGARTTAVRSADGRHWILNGTKQFITNAGFADLYTVYAKVDGEQFSAFVVEADTEGVSTGPEEHKMGIKGSSTRQLILQDVRIPAENLLGEIGKGHKVALNVLNIGRLKLGACCLGASKEIFGACLQYAAERKQFNRTLDAFQLIREKLADMALAIYGLESMAYRCSGAIDDVASLSPPPTTARKLASVEEHIIEASILKVLGSEILSAVADEGVQIHGGYGFIEEYPVCGAYRDARINRLFEGTNEINRMLIPSTLMKRALRGQIDLMSPVMQLMSEIKADTVPREPGDGTLGRENTAVRLLRKWTQYGLGVTAKKAMEDEGYLQHNQILLAQLADLIMDLYHAESSYLRALKTLDGRSGEAHRTAVRLVEVIVYERLRHAAELVRQICANVAGDDAAAFAADEKALRRLGYSYGLDTMARKEAIAGFFIDQGRYRLP